MCACSGTTPIQAQRQLQYPAPRRRFSSASPHRRRIQARRHVGGTLHRLSSGRHAVSQRRLGWQALGQRKQAARNQAVAGAAAVDDGRRQRRHVADCGYGVAAAGGMSSSQHRTWRRQHSLHQQASPLTGDVLPARRQRAQRGAVRPQSEHHMPHARLKQRADVWSHAAHRRLWPCCLCCCRRCCCCCACLLTSLAPLLPRPLWLQLARRGRHGCQLRLVWRHIGEQGQQRGGPHRLGH